MERIKATLNGNTQNLPRIGKDRYQGKLNAPTTKTKEAVYPVMITATGDNGGVSEETRDLIVRNADLFPLEFTIARENGEELGFLDQSVAIDMDLGNTDDFEIRLSQEEWTKEWYWYGNRIFVPGTEYGGILNSLKVMTKTKEIVWRGTTWRGVLKQKIVEPPEGEDHLTVSGDLNDILRELIKDRFDGLFFVPEEKAGIAVTSWQIDRYVTLYDAVDKMLSAQGYRLQISYTEPENLDYGYVSIRAVQAKDYSETLEYSQDGEVQFTVKDYRGGVNHLICAGKGQNEERIIPYGDYIDCEIANGQSGRNRNDIIIAKFVTTGTGGIDTFTLEVKQGASTTGSATDPALTQNNLYESGKIREMPLYRVKIEGLSITKVEKMFESVPTIPMLNTYLSELQSYHDKKMLTPTDLGLNTATWKTIANNSYKIGKTIHLNMEFYTNAIIVENNVYNNIFTIPSQYRPLIDTVVNTMASDSTYKNAVACTAMVKANGNLFICIPKATNNYLFIDAEWEVG